VATDIAKPLYHHTLALQISRQTRDLHIFGVTEEFAQRVLQPTPGGLDPTHDPARAQRLAGDTGAAFISEVNMRAY